MPSERVKELIAQIRHAQAKVPRDNDEREDLGHCVLSWREELRKLNWGSFNRPDPGE
jgi:hypothetical protein